LIRGPLRKRQSALRLFRVYRESMTGIQVLTGDGVESRAPQLIVVLAIMTVMSITLLT
jgi:hypothetical protein